MMIYFQLQHYIHHPDHHHVLYIAMLINLQVIDPWFTMGKISKVVPQPKSISTRKGRDTLWQKVQIFWLKIWYGLTVHICFFVSKFTTNFFKFTLCLLAKFPAHYTNSAQFAQKSHK